MTDISKYSTEWFIKNKNNLTTEQKKIIDKLKDGANQELENDVLLPQSIFVGSKSHVTSFFEYVKSFGDVDLNSFTDLIDKFGGIDNVFNLMDENGDGNVTLDELSNIAQANTGFFDEDVDKNLSTNDLKAIYENAMKAKDGSFEQEGNIQRFTFKDGTIKAINTDKSGKVHSKYLQGQSKSQGIASVGVDYDTQTVFQNIRDKEGRIISSVIDAPGKNDDRTFSIKYNDNEKTRNVEVKTAGTKYESTITEEQGRVSNNKSITYQIDGVIGDTKQQSLGDCWLLSGVTAIAGTQKGAKLIKDAIKQNDDGSVTVTLKGINRSYTFSADEVGGHDYVDKRKRYSEGDLDMNLLEMALTKYRQELIKKYPDYWNYRSASASDPANAGLTDEAFRYLTGKVPETIIVSESEKSLDNLLDKIQKNSERYATQIAFISDDTSVGTGKDIVFAHAYNISRVTENTVYVRNPWDTSKEIAYPKDKFVKNCREISFIDMK